MFRVLHDSFTKRAIVFVVTAVLVSVVVSYSLPPTYRAQVVLQFPDNDSARFAFAALSGADVEASVVRSADLVHALGVRDTDAAREVLRRMTEPVFDAKLLTLAIDVIARDPVLAAGTANAYRDALMVVYTAFEDSRVAMELARRSRDGAVVQDAPVRFPGLVVIENANAPQYPSGPDRLLIILTTAIVSVGSTLLVAAVRRWRENDRVGHSGGGHEQ